MDARQWSDPEVTHAYKGPSHGEGGVRFLQDSLWFVASLFVKKPCRLQGLLLIMTLALVVSSGAPRRRRQPFAHAHDPVPNQRNRPTPSPTVRWIFQRLAGIHRVRVTVQGQVHDRIEGLHDVQIKVLRLLGEQVCRLYQISPG